MLNNLRLNKNKLSFLFIFIWLFFFGQSNGDFRSVVGGALPPGTALAWGSPATWEIYNATTGTWVPATTFPGQSGTNSYTVSIQKNSYVQITGDQTYSFGTLNVYGVLILNSSSGSGNLINFSTTQLVNIIGPSPQETVAGIGNGTIYWNGKVDLYLATGANVNITNYNNNGVTKNGLQSSNCNNNNTLYIGPAPPAMGAQRFSVCTGGGNADFTFNQIDVNMTV